ncbi:MAG: hypothetical protein JRH15_06320 [Deltaproteobacteria bacterium]|nr:hypothetical protein [Deltaproteobacteria bacterium]
MNAKEKKPRECFADLETVFPMGERGLRETPPKCLDCKDKTECLRAAMSRPSGIGVREEMVDRAYDSGLMNFFQRWSKKKTFFRRRRRAEKSDDREKDQ